MCPSTVDTNVAGDVRAPLRQRSLSRRRDDAAQRSPGHRERIREIGAVARTRLARVHSPYSFIRQLRLQPRRGFRRDCSERMRRLRDSASFAEFPYLT